MFRSIEDFANVWSYESDCTKKLLANLTDAELGRPIADGFWTLGELANHIAIVIPVIGSMAGLDFPDAPATDVPPVPSSAKEICDAYDKFSASVVEQVKANWTDSDLDKTDKYFNHYDWAKGFALHIMVTHQSHHRGQMSVLMRQAGLPLSGIYGPTKEETEAFMESQQA